MKWFDQWFYRKARWCWHRAEAKYPELKAEQDCLDEMYDRNGIRDSHVIPNSRVMSRTRDEGPTIKDSSDGVNMDHSIRFNVLSCRGGLVLEVRVYDKKTHENVTKTYLIPEGEPVAERIGQYVTMEMMVN
jgi:hypothetical protein